VREIRRVVVTHFLFFVASAALCGCGVVGPASIKLGRSTYNDVIHQTSGDQLLANLVRIHNHEMPLFMDVTEVDAVVQVQANISAGKTNIGARATNSTSAGTVAGAVENISAAGQYLEAPTIRYQPLQGAPLIAQINSPISVDSFVSMFNSDWPLDALLPLTVDRLTAGFSDYYSALNAIIALDHNGALIIEAAPSGQIAASGQNSKKATAVGPNNALTLYFVPKGLANDNFKCETSLKYTQVNIQRVSVYLWLRLLRIYRPTDVHIADAHIRSASSLAELQKIISQLPTSIEIPAASLPGRNRNRSAPLLRTRSALGVMKNVVEGEYSLAKFVTPEQASSIINEQPIIPGCRRPEHYYTMGDIKNSDNFELGKQQAITTSYKPDADARSEGILYNSRKYMLIQVSDIPPIGAFVSAFESGHFYYIADDDVVSKRTLALLTLITSVQAIPAQSGGLTPALSIGAK
jgi:hypothetical protein